MKLNRHCRGWVVATLACLALSPAWAQIRIGQTAGFTGPVAAGVKETTEGARLYLDSVNKNGGINGQAIELVSLDDKFEPPLAAENARKLIDDGVLALFLTRGTPHNQAIIPLVTAAHVPLIAPSTGSMVLHQPVQPWVFNVRASYQREAERAVRHLSLIGMSRIGLVHVNDSFGEDGAKGAMTGFKAVGREPAVDEKFDREKPDLAPVIAKLVKADVQAVIVVGSGTVVADALGKLRAAGSRAQLVTLSNNASQGFIKTLGDNARGTIITQVFPYERSINNGMVKEAMGLVAAQGKGAELTPAMLEGFAGAKVLVEALKRASPNITRERIKSALESFKRYDLGGLEVSFSTTDHSGLDYSDLSIVGEDGHFRR
ncbi:MAG TPA: ABC transporter substrate-binding protein [Ideonella sp.]|uniref:ABC transporter substrate-binding protein n=1 Tax=Ideonella sp. TaxID=1929293 RepID=UPI002D1A9640|nr:ABC transporter substrate-binding protein [Ideonella sp.]HSI49783.1 ABC transporter substrate-binding protein [Ideonella sp.]